MTNLNTLSIEDVDCIRGERTLFHGLKSHISSKQCLHVIGSNGCGKTSLLRQVSGLASFETGEILWNNNSINNNTSYLDESAFIGHKDALKNELSAIENLRFFQNSDLLKGKKQTLTKQQKEKALDECLNQLEILHCADLLAQQLSFGQRRRLTFARLLLKPYKLWILDEPFTGIDVKGRHIIENLCLQHLNSGGIIILTHHQSLQQSVFNAHLAELHLENYS